MREIIDDRFAALLERISRAREGDASAYNGSTSQRLAVALAVGGPLIAPYTSHGAAWLRLDDCQRRAVRDANPEVADYAEADSRVARIEGFPDHGTPPYRT